MRKKIIILALNLFLVISASSQNIEGRGINASHEGTIALEPNENYILTFQFDSIIHSDKCPCSTFENTKKKCLLVQGKVMDVVSIPTPKEYLMTENEIKQISYILIPKGKLIFKTGQHILISAYSPISKKYLVYVATRNPNETKNYFHKILMQSPSDCYGGEPSKKKVKKDKFVDFIGGLRK